MDWIVLFISMCVHNQNECSPGELLSCERWLRHGNTHTHDLLFEQFVPTTPGLRAFPLFFAGQRNSICMHS